MEPGIRKYIGEQEVGNIYSDYEEDSVVDIYRWCIS